MRYKQKKIRTRIWTDKELDIEKLSEEIRIKLKATKWEDSPDKEGFSGISVVDNPNWKAKKLPNRKLIIIHWTLDGKEGFDIELTSKEKQDIALVVAKHVKIKA